MERTTITINLPNDILDWADKQAEKAYQNRTTYFIELLKKERDNEASSATS